MFHSTTKSKAFVMAMPTAALESFSAKCWFRSQWTTFDRCCDHDVFTTTSVPYRTFTNAVNILTSPCVGMFSSPMEIGTAAANSELRAKWASEFVAAADEAGMPVLLADG